MNDHSHSTVLNLHRFVSGREHAARVSEDSSLTASIQLSVKAAANTGVKIVTPADVELPPAQMLGAVSYCYAKGLYDSAEIEEKMRRSPEFRAAANGNVPGASLTRSCWRLNPEAIHAALEEAFRFLWRKAKASAFVPLPGQALTYCNSGTFNPETTSDLRAQGS